MASRIQGITVEIGSDTTKLTTVFVAKVKWRMLQRQSVLSCISPCRTKDHLRIMKVGCLTL